MGGFTANATTEEVLLELVEVSAEAREMHDPEASGHGRVFADAQGIGRSCRRRLKRSVVEQCAQDEVGVKKPLDVVVFWS